MAGRDHEINPEVVEFLHTTSTDVAEDSDAIGSRTHRADWWRTRRSQYLIGAILLIVAVLIAYQLGSKARKASPASPPASDVSPAAISSPVVGRSPAIAETGQYCATQVGTQLQLGIQIVNQSGAALTLMTLTPVLPIGGLRAAAQTAGTCGQLTLTAPVAGFGLASGATAWVAMTFDVLEQCPTPYPVQFSFVIAQGSRSSTIALGGFADLSGVSYSGCAAAS